MESRSASNYIGGRLRATKDVLHLANPVTGAPTKVVARSGEEDVEAACLAARDAAGHWRDVGVPSRASIVKRAAEILGKEGSAEGIVSTICEETGKPRAEARVEVMEAADILAYFAAVAEEGLAPRPNDLDTSLWPTKSSIVEWEPFGVVALIKPWNYPFELPIWSLGPALLAGNAVVLKPSEYTPSSSLEIAGVFESAGLPAGVLNVVCGDGSVGDALVKSRQVEFVSFTGSTRTGRAIAHQCVDRGRPYSLELSGNDAAVVLDDASLNYTARGLLWGAIGNAGQVCTAIKRVLVPESIADDLVAELASVILELIPGRDYGPLIDEPALLRCEELIADAQQHGGVLVTGGKRLGDSGFLIQPALLDRVSTSARLWTEELFGPVLPVTRVGSEVEAIRMANASEFGLGASVWTSELARASRVASELDVGMVWVNDVNLPLPQGPWSGRRSSGNGLDLSVDALKKYSQVKHLCIESDTSRPREWWYPYLDGTEGM